MTSMPNYDLVHHLYRNPGKGAADTGDLLPYCGALPGPDKETGDWHTGHDRDLLLQCLDFGLCCCSTCLSPKALGGWTPLILDDARDQERTGVPDDRWWVD